VPRLRKSEEFPRRAKRITEVGDMNDDIVRL